MQTTNKHFANVLTGGILVLVLTAAGEMWAADQIRGIGGQVAENGPVATTEPGTSGEQGESETDGWFRWYFWRTHYYCQPVQYYYYYPVYYPATTWGSYVVYYDGVDGANGTAEETVSDMVTDGLARPRDAH